MNQKLIKTIQEIANNAWPASYNYLMEGWIVRLDKRVTYRANSVLPLNWWGDDLLSSVEKVEKIYNQNQSPSIFMLHDKHEPKGLESLLIDLSYKRVMPTNVMGIEVSKIPNLEDSVDFTHKYSEKRLPIWYPELERLSPWRTPKKLSIMGEIMDRVTVPTKRFFYTEYNKKIIGVMLAIIDGSFMGTLNLAVDENYKRKGVATGLIKTADIWASSEGVKSIYLQVESENTPAVDLYKKLGFKEWYSYRYYEK